MIGAYKNYPFNIPLRVKFFNLFRALFTIPFFEKLLVNELSKRSDTFWSRLIPPLYFYRSDSYRVCERHGVKFRVDISQLIDHSIYFNKIKDTAWSNLFPFLKDDFNVIDAGANIGYLSLHFARTCSRGIVYAFEPDSDNFLKLKSNIELNNFRNIRQFRFALGAQKGEAKLYKMFMNNPGANRILEGHEEINVKHETVEVRALDDFLNPGLFRKIDLIKIDVEGYEVFVLRGAEALIKKDRPLLFIELADDNLKKHNLTSYDLIKHVRSLGYHVLDARFMKPVDENGKSHHTDIICFPIESSRHEPIS